MKQVADMPPTTHPLHVNALPLLRALYHSAMRSARPVDCRRRLHIVLTARQHAAFTALLAQVLEDEVCTNDQQLFLDTLGSAAPRKQQPASSVSQQTLALSVEVHCGKGRHQAKSEVRRHSS